MAMAMQQVIPARMISVCKTFGESPSAMGLRGAVVPGAATAGMGARVRNSRARGTMVRKLAMPMIRCAWRQPIVEMPHCSKVGQKAPAK